MIAEIDYVHSANLHLDDVKLGDRIKVTCEAVVTAVYLPDGEATAAPKAQVALGAFRQMKEAQ